MNRSIVISAAGHLVLLALALLSGQLFESDRARAIQITEVDLVSAEALDAAISTAPAAPAAEIPELTQPYAAAEAPDFPEAATPPERAEAVRPGTDAADPAPDLEGLRSAEAADIPIDAPETPQTLAEDSAPEGASLVTPRAIGPAIPESERQRPDASALAPPAPPAPAPRISSTPAPKPPVEAREAEEAAPEVAPAPDATETAEERPPEAPREAATEIVPEAEGAIEPESAAPLASAPPRRRPERQPERQVAEEAPPPAPARGTETAAADPAPARPSAPASNRPVGPPVTRAEKDGITLPIKRWWNFGPLRGTQGWEELVVEVRFSVSPDGRIVGDVTPHAPANPQGNMKRAFDAARRAILIAEREGELRFPPAEKYERWKEIIITFDPKSQNVGF